MKISNLGIILLPNHTKSRFRSGRVNEVIGNVGRDSKASLAPIAQPKGVCGMTLLLVWLALCGARTYGQSADPAFQWAVTASGYNFYPDIVYKKANGQDILLDVIATEPSSTLKPTLLYIHGGGWVNGKKGDTTLAPLPYLARGMNAVNIDYRL